MTLRAPCSSCRRPMSSAPCPPAGFVRHGARGACQACVARAKRRLAAPTHPVARRLLADIPSWHEDANPCRATDPNLFFPETGGPTSRMARWLCVNRCHNTVACLEWAMERGELRWGIYGGLTARERRRLAVERGKRRDGDRAA